MSENTKNKDIRISPSIIEAEAAVLGCILINPEAMAKSMEFLNEKDFYNHSNATIYENMLVLFEGNNTIDYISVIEQLKKTKKLKEVGDAYYITGLTEQAPSTQNVEYYAKLVREKSILRNIINVASTISNEAYDNQSDVTEILDKAEQTLFSLSKDADKGRFKEIKPLLHDVLENWVNRKEGSLTGVPSSFYDLDNMLSTYKCQKLVDNNRKLVKIKCGKFDKYGRLLGTIYPHYENENQVGGGFSFNQILINDYKFTTQCFSLKDIICKWFKTLIESHNLRC